MRHTLGKEVAQSVAPTVTHLCVLDAQTTDNIWHRVVVVDIFSPAVYLLYLNKLHVPTGPSCNLTHQAFSYKHFLAKMSSQFIRFFYFILILINEGFYEIFLEFKNSFLPITTFVFHVHILSQSTKEGGSPSGQNPLCSKITPLPLKNCTLCSAPPSGI